MRLVHILSLLTLFTVSSVATSGVVDPDPLSHITHRNNARQVRNGLRVLGAIGERGQMGISEQDQIDAVEDLAKRPAMDEIIEGFILTTQYLLSQARVSRGITPLDHRLILLMLGSLRETGSANHWHSLNMVWNAYRDLEIEAFQNSIAPALRQSLDAMSTRMISVNSLDFYERGETRKEIEARLRYAQEIARKYGDHKEDLSRANNVTAFPPSCKAELSPTKDEGPETEN